MLIVHQPVFPGLHTQWSDVFKIVPQGLQLMPGLSVETAVTEENCRTFQLFQLILHSCISGFVFCVLQHCHVSNNYRRVLDWLSDFLDIFTARDYTLQITITHKPVFSVMLLRNGFQRRTFLYFRGHVITGRRLSHANLGLQASAGTSFSC
jgi:hypothetical protein